MARKSIGNLVLIIMLIGLSILPGNIITFQSSNANAEELASVAKPPFSDTAGTVFDIIKTSDPSVFTCLQYMGRGQRQIWDKRVKNEPIVNAYLFISRYSDGTSIEIAINPEFETKENARTEAQRYAKPLGQLPTTLRQGVKRLSVHSARAGFHAGTGQIVAYADTTDNRLGYNHLEETLFHESVHASWDAEHRLAAGWVEAQTRDKRFLTSYGQKSPEREDLAETALFAFAILHHPDRFPPADTTDSLNAVPHRIDYIRKLLPADTPLIYQVDDAKLCGADVE